ncbi:hypothetical protein EV702DRAFT_1076118 [Suillus placidus]|uniref:DNA helicase n=1 Tax=Suillus placidus TaxID=48579 RepID=A0A9P7D6H8_9AGAM|nr:hypothetical protein EV702DRAFT_1076118 [Suillus placidus]
MVLTSTFLNMFLLLSFSRCGTYWLMLALASIVLLSRHETYSSTNSMIKFSTLPGHYIPTYSLDIEQTPGYLAMLTAPGIPPHRLDLKINCICTILRNLSIEKDLIRHARVQITALYH